MSSLKLALTAIWSQFETRATENTKITLSGGVLALPLPNNDGHFIRLCVDKLER